MNARVSRGGKLPASCPAQRRVSGDGLPDQFRDHGPHPLIQHNWCYPVAAEDLSDPFGRNIAQYQRFDHISKRQSFQQEQCVAQSGILKHRGTRRVVPKGHHNPQRGPHGKQSCNEGNDLARTKWRQAANRAAKMTIRTGLPSNARASSVSAPLAFR